MCATLMTSSHSEGLGIDHEPKVYNPYRRVGLRDYDVGDIHLRWEAVWRDDKSHHWVRSAKRNSVSLKVFTGKRGLGFRLT